MEKITNTTRAFFRMCAAISFSGFTEMAPTLTPLAPAAFFALAIATAFFERLPEALPHTAAITLAILVGLVAAGGLEAAGFMAFHSAIEAYRLGAGWRAAILPGLYLIIGITALWVVEEATTATIGTALFLLAATVYAARMVMHDAKHKAKDAAEATQRQAEEEAAAKVKQETAAAEQAAFDREQLAKDRELERELMRKEQADKTAVQLAKIEAKAQTVTSRPVTSRSDSGQIPGDARLHTREHKELIKTLTTSEIKEISGVSGSTARRWKRELSANGHLNGATK